MDNKKCYYFLGSLSAGWGAMVTREEKIAEEDISESAKCGKLPNHMRAHKNENI